MSLTKLIGFEEVNDSCCRVSLLDMFGREKTKTFDCITAKIRHSYYSWKDGMLIQEAFPYLNKSDREFFFSGLSDDEWNNIMGSDDDE